MNEAQRAFLYDSAELYIWWKPPSESMLYPQRILAQIMNIGFWEDWCKMSELFSDQNLQDVLDTAEIGQFNERSWHFWHNRLSGGHIPPMPERKLP